MSNTWKRVENYWTKKLDKSLFEHGLSAVSHESMHERFFPKFPESPVNLDIYFSGEIYKENILKVENDKGTRKGSLLYRIKFSKELRRKIEIHCPEYHLSNKSITDLNYQIWFNKKGNKCYELSISKGSYGKLKKEVYGDNEKSEDQLRVRQEYNVRNPKFQKEFKDKLKIIWNNKCPVTQINDIKLLIGAHIKPFKKCNPSEAFDEFNGILLSPNIDLVFELGYVSFTDDGKILLSNEMNKVLLNKLGIDKRQRIKFKEQHTEYLDWHRREHKF